MAWHMAMFNSMALTNKRYFNKNFLVLRGRKAIQQFDSKRALG